MSDLQKVIWETLQKHLKRLNWQCGYCPKILECEKQPSIYNDGEGRYCERMIKAAVFEEIKFTQPFKNKESGV